jgi:hypothetical protein
VGQVGGVGEEGEDQLDRIGHPLAGFEALCHGVDGSGSVVCVRDEAHWLLCLRARSIE